jgi:hypothetical protein
LRNRNQVEYELLSEDVNDFFISVSDSVSPLGPNAPYNLHKVMCQIVLLCLSILFGTTKYLKVNKSSCDELLTNQLLVELADVFAAPICVLINSSISHG